MGQHRQKTSIPKKTGKGQEGTTNGNKHFN